MFTFLDPDDLSDAEVRLSLIKTEPAEASIWKAPTYRFDICIQATGERIGHINLRIGDSLLLTHYVGHVGYGIDEPFRGRHLAERAVRILLPFAARHGMETIWITTAPDNPASRRTLERLGAEFIGIFDVPADYPLPEGAIRQKCRYRLNLGHNH
jgi:predicted acetyltransferase